MLTESQRYDYVKDVCIDIEDLFPTLPADVIAFIACQFALESNYGTSSLAKIQRNHCGMRNPMVRPSTSLVRGDGTQQFAAYRSRLDCIIDYFLCITFQKPFAKVIENLDMYKTFIGKFYCPEKGYIDRINKIYQQFKTQRNERRKSD